MSSIKLNITMTPKVKEQLDNQCKKYGMKKSTYISLAIMEKAKSDEAVSIVPDMVEAIKKLQEMQNAKNIDMNDLQNLLNEGDNND